MNVIAYIRNDFQEKFGIPRQSGVVETALSEIIFEPDYRSAGSFVQSMKQFIL